MGGCCLPYSDKTHQKQTWLKNYMWYLFNYILNSIVDLTFIFNKLINSKWSSNSRKRTKAMPHIKSYCRVSPCCTEMSWFLLTSANLSKAAWGRQMKSDRSNYIISHEAGVLFLPQFLVDYNIYFIDIKYC